MDERPGHTTRLTGQRAALLYFNDIKELVSRIDLALAKEENEVNSDSSVHGELTDDIKGFRTIYRFIQTCTICYKR